MNSNYRIEIPTWDNGVWTETVFDDRREMYEFVKSLFKEPGKYEFDDTSYMFNEQARNFKANRNVYNISPYLSNDFIKYWDGEKKKCRNGVIFRNGEHTWYLTRDYYMWINFLPIFDKIKKKYDFPQVWDIQYHVALYECLAELDYKHIAICKKRQCAMSYFHCAKLINQLWFEEGVQLKIGASLKKYVSDDFVYLKEYRNFLNEHTAWYRPMSPDTALEWTQQIEMTQGGKKMTKGLKGHLVGISFEHSATGSVGGPCHRLGTKILMADGRFKNVEDINIGEYVYGIDHKPKRVEKTFRGEDYMYHVIPKRSEDFYATGEHILSLYSNDHQVHGDRERKIKVCEWDQLSGYKKDRWVLKRNNEMLDFGNNTDCTLDPYFLGLWLGDGYRQMIGLIINKTRDPEILDYCKSLSNKINYPLKIHRKELHRYNDEMYSVYFPISVNFNDGPLTKEFIKYNLFYHKHIPDEYLYGSKEVRAQLLAGIIDTDGHFAAKRLRFEITQKDDVLFNQIVFLARSLGAMVHTRKIPSQSHIVDGRLIKYTETNVCTIGFDDPSIIPCKIARKKTAQKKRRTTCTSPIKEIVKLGIEEYAGIQVEDNHYFLEDLTITHNCTLLYHEEAGIAPLMDKTFEFVRPALQMGEITTGTFIASGSVGELKDADTLKSMIYHPEDNGIYAIETNLIDENGSRGMSGLFLPEQWAMPPYIDDFGNSQVEEALAALNKQFEEWKKTLSPQQYQLRVSQHPRNLRECFASRTVSIFPTALIEDQTIRIKDHEYPYELVDLEEDLYRNEIVVKKAVKAPIREWPIRKNAEDKEGAIVVWERPDKEFKPGTYVASIDPVSVGATTESDSLCSIYVYKMPTLVKHMSDRGVENYIEGDKIVCAWCGRFDDLTDTHKRLRLIIEWYRAETLVENNVPQFITYMIHERKQNYLVPESNILFLKEVAPARPNQVKYGWRNVGNFFKRNMLPYLVDYLKEVIHEDCDDAGNVTKKTFGISRIPDIMAMEEMRGYDEKVNTDRLISLASLIAYVQIKISNTKMSERVDNQEDTPVNYDQYKIRSNPFSAIGRSKSPFSAIRKSPFIKMH